MYICSPTRRKMLLPNSVRLIPRPFSSFRTPIRLNPVMQIGRKISQNRTAEETMIANFWRANVQLYTNDLVQKVNTDSQLKCPGLFF